MNKLRRSEAERKAKTERNLKERKAATKEQQRTLQQQQFLLAPRGTRSASTRNAVPARSQSIAPRPPTRNSVNPPRGPPTRLADPPRGRVPDNNAGRKSTIQATGKNVLVVKTPAQAGAKSRPASQKGAVGKKPRSALASQPANSKALNDLNKRLQSLAPANRSTKFGKNDLLYGPSAKGRLRAWRNRRGGVLLDEDPRYKHLNRELGQSWWRTSKKALIDAARTGRQVHFDLTNLTRENISAALSGKGKDGKTITSRELRYIRDNWNSFRTKPKYYVDNTERAPPWTWVDSR